MTKNEGWKNTPKHPKPNMGSTEKEHLEYCIRFYRERLVLMEKEKPKIFRDEWVNEYKRINNEIHYCTFELYKYTDPELYNEVKDLIK